MTQASSAKHLGNNIYRCVERETFRILTVSADTCTAIVVTLYLPRQRPGDLMQEAAFAGRGSGGADTKSTAAEGGHPAAPGQIPR